jgi:hypothetical protein
MKSSKNKTEIDDIQPFINILKDAQKQLEKIGIYLDFSIYTNGLYEYQDYEKYKDYTKEQLQEVIRKKNATISTLNGKVWYCKNDAKYYKNRLKKEKEKNKCLQEMKK